MKTLKSSFNEYFTNKRIQQTPYYLIALLTFNMIVVVTLTIILLYTLGFNRQKDHLIELVETQAVMINIVAQQELLLHNNISPEMKKKLAEEIVQKVTHAHYRYASFGKTGEFTLGKREDDKIQFLIKQRHFNINKPTSIPWKSHLGEPMRRALNGIKGADVTFDYRGRVVLAAYEPIKELEWGLVAKIDLSEVRAPYIEAAQYALGLTLLLAFAGSLLFWYFLHPLVQDIEDSRHFNSMLITNSTAGLALCSLKGNLIDVNSSFLNLVGFTADEIKRINYFSLISDSFLAREKKHLNLLIKNGNIDPYETLYVSKNGQHTCVKVSGNIVSIKGKSYIWLSVDSIQDYKEREAELLLSDAVFHNTSEVIFITDASANIIKVNEAFTNVTGFEFEDVVGKNPKIFKSGKHDNQYYDDMFHFIHTTGRWRGEIWNKRKDGTLYPSLQSISAIHDDAGRLIRYVAILTDITIQKAYEEQLLIDSHHDSLTGLPNRLFLNQILNQTLARAQRSQKIFALFFIDLNLFKEVNDTYGHETGDTLLKTVALRLQENIRSDDFAARFGGDEFTIIFESINDKNDAINVAKNLIDKVAQSIYINEIKFTPSISIGIAFYPEHGTDAATLLKCADQAMYFAKHHTEEYYSLFN